ncbi:MAG TPA: hypothetical protein VKB88_17815 [Bryobacteraceae bacterium]|nr:hypothetical protein [Bryobacteraceae bacterium]
MFRIGFRSDRRNWLVEHPVEGVAPNIDDLNFFAPIEEIEREMAAYGSILMYVLVRVDSARIETWRNSLPHPLLTGDIVAGCHLGDLVGNGRQWMIANLANPKTRHQRIWAIVCMIKENALPYFERLRDPKKIVADAIKTSGRGWGIREPIEYAFFHCGKAAAMSLFKRRLKMTATSNVDGMLCYPDFQADYKKALEDFRQHGIPAPNTSFGNVEQQLAFIALALGLEPMK